MENAKYFKRYTKRWLIYGQNFIEKQKLLKAIGEVAFFFRQASFFDEEAEH